MISFLVLDLFFEEIFLFQVLKLNWDAWRRYGVLPSFGLGIRGRGRGGGIMIRGALVRRGGGAAGLGRITATG
jgi:hypothetical protein